MPSPWDDKQKPNEKSPEHGKKKDGHGPKEFGTGAKKPLKKEDAPTFTTFLTDAAATPEEKANASLGDSEVLVTSAFPSRWLQPNRPPILNQNDTPMCVAFCNSSDQAHMDRPEYGAFPNFDESKFFYQIGGGPDGAYLSAAMAQRKEYGYPIVNVGHRGAHRIANYYQVDPTVSAIKTGLQMLPNNGSVIRLMPWYHSWFHPLTNGKLPSPDYFVSYHAIYLDGWDDNRGFRFRQSWGTSWGLNGKGYLPYVYIGRALEIWRTKDR